MTVLSIKYNIHFANQIENRHPVLYTYMLKHREARKVIVAHRKKPIKESTVIYVTTNSS